ncbi:MAG TPA: two-component regulator propeller domain-containing protein, partial [Prolixibacteraceae bacterium]|nr:two-component regulator propeller domain-containing protein [Prolixibacteraceae bacterium]
MNGQKLKFYNSEQGIPSSVIYDVSQDSRGYIWIATEAGASYYDGVNFNTFYCDSNLPGSLKTETVKNIFTDSRETCWVGSINGLQIYDKKKNVFIDFDLQYPSFTGTQYVSSIVENKKSGKILVSISGCGILVYDIFTHEIDMVTTKRLNRLYDEKYLGVLYFDREGDLWSFSEQGAFYKADIENYAIEKVNWSPQLLQLSKHIVVSAITDIPGGSNILIGTYNHGLYIYDRDLGHVRKIRGAKQKKYRIRSLLTAQNSIGE